MKSFLPVYPGYFADPFVLAHEGRYYAYGTGPRPADGRVFEVLRSADLRHWVSLGGALAAPEDDPALAYWAPEVAAHDGRLFMYYSVGVGDQGHRLRLASAERPEGPFEDCGLELTDAPFAIDPHPFRDRDGQWYLFYATDFLDGPRVGTGLVVDRLPEMTRLAGSARTVLRASADWQLFERRREIYGGTYDWHTLEGPFVVRRGGRYICFYSGGRWENESYGVAYAVAEHPLGPWREAGAGARVLSSQPGLVGPGHNSVVRAFGGEEYLVFHAWDGARTARRMHLGRLEWRGERPRVTPVA